MLSAGVPSRRAFGCAVVVVVLTVAVVLSGCGSGSTSSLGGGSGSSRTTGATPPSFHPSAEAVARHRRLRRAGLRAPQEAELVSGRQGWARIGHGVYWTGDGGRRWRAITPPVRSPLDLQGVFFADPRRGWALAEEGHEGDEHPVFLTTVDGGRHWRRSPTPIEGLLLPATSVSFDPVGRHLVFALVKQSGDTAENFGFLLRSDDGGHSWRQTATKPPQAGRIRFESAHDGWLASGSPAQKLWRTEDGGRSWTQVEPRQLPRHPGEQVSYLPPRIAADGHGLLPALWSPRGARETEAVVYATTDRGKSWRIATVRRLPRVGLSEPARVFAYRGATRSLFVHDPLTPAAAIIGTDGHVERSLRSKGMPGWASPSFSGKRFGFGLSALGVDQGLVFTADGGRSWHRIGPVE